MSLITKLIEAIKRLLGLNNPPTPTPAPPPTNVEVAPPPVPSPVSAEKPKRGRPSSKLKNAVVEK